MDSDAVAVVLAAGSGSRVGADGNKAYLRLDGRSMLVWSLDTLARMPEVARTVLVFRQGESDLARSTVARELPDTGLVLVGDGPLRARLEAEAAASGFGDRIRLLGDRNDVRALLPGLAVFALSSASEGYSMALLEACASALPIVATDVGGNGEIVRDRFNGRLVPARDAGALASALLDLLRLPPPALALLGDAGREWVLAEGSFARMAERYEALYGDAPGAGGHAPAAAA